LGINKNGKSIFCVATQKSLVTKVVGIGNMHISVKKWGQYSKVCYRACINQAQLGRKSSEVLFGAIFYEEFFSKMLVCHVLYFF
jgi:hypothetical protein